MPRGGHVKQVKQSLGNRDLQDTFNQMLGGGEKDLKIIWPKYKKVRYQTRRCLKLFEWLISQEWLTEHFPEEMRAIKLYKDQLHLEFIDHFESVENFDQFGTALEVAMLSDKEEERLDHVPNFTMASPEAIQQFQTLYGLAVDSQLVSTLVVICQNLSSFKTSLEDREKLSLQFLRHACMRFTPIPQLPAANFKAFYDHPNGTDGSREGLTIFLHRLYQTTHDVYEAASLPDINVDEFSDIVCSSLEELRGHLPRCKDALDKISESIELLKANFSSYYRDMKGSNNPGLILEHFVRDVATNTKSSITVRRQFGEIIRFYRNAAKQRPMDAKAQSIFKEIDSNFSKLQNADAGADEEPAAVSPKPVDVVTGGAPPPTAEPLIQSAPAAETEEEKEARRKEIKKSSKKRAKARQAAARRIESTLEADLGESTVPNALLQHLLQTRSKADITGSVANVPSESSE